MSAVLEFENISRSFKKGKPVLQDISFSVSPGEVVGLLGRNGAGKTTLINIAMGLLRPEQGAVRLFGLSPMGEPVATKKRVGYVCEGQIFPFFATVERLIALHREIFPMWDTAMEKDLLHRFQLSTKSRIVMLSKG